MKKYVLQALTMIYLRRLHSTQTRGKMLGNWSHNFSPLENVRNPGKEKENPVSWLGLAC